MCGINGIYNHLSLNDSKSQVVKMNLLSSHRGPDNSGIYEDADLVLGHVRLSIIDLDARSNQPFISQNQQIVLSFNGEIYNFQALKKELEEYPFSTHSDTEVIVAAYLKWGIKFLDKLDGMFAFALWDRSAKQLILARDKMGIKPLYYFEKNNSLVFSSEIRSLLSCAIVERKLNANALQDYLQYSTVHGPDTIVEGVKLLPAGHYYIVKEDELSLHSYWDIRSKYNFQSTSKPIEEIQKDIGGLFNKSVQKRLVSDVSYGAFLSGGIDSSAVVAAASNFSDFPVKTFCVSFENQKFDESRYAQLISDLYSTDHMEIKLSPNDFLKDIPNALLAMDHPSGDGPNSYVVAKAAKAAGVTMALSGLGGDDVFIYKKKYHTVKDENYGYRTSGITGTILNLLRDYHNVTTIGFYLIKRIRRWETDMYFRPYNPKMTWEEKDKLYNKNRQLFNKDKVCTVPQKGYDDYYIVNAKDMKVQNVDLQGINDTMKPGKIKSLFSKSMKGRITSRVLLNKFIEKVA